MLGVRSHTRELMDEPDLPGEAVRSALRELSVINQFLGGWSTSRRGLQMLAPAESSSRRLEVLDIGAGGADVLRGRRNGAQLLRITTLDSNEEACRYQRSVNNADDVLCGDARTYPFADESFDIVHASLFLHHFDEGTIEEMLTRFLRISRYGIVVNDLQRSIAAYAGIWTLTRLLSRSTYVRNDGPLSVRRAFRRGDLIRICSRLGCSSFSVSWHWAFRWLVLIRK